MLTNVFNTLESSAYIVGAITYEIGVKQLKDNLGYEDFPLIYIELPILIEDQVTSVKVNFTGYAMYIRKEKTKEEELLQLNNSWLLARAYLRELEKYNFMAGNYLTYSGIELAEFSNDLNGVRFEFSLLMNNC